MSEKIHFETLGCKLNQVESEGAASAFKKTGFEISMQPFSAASKEDRNVRLCVVNTCTVTAKAEQKARRIIRLLLAKCPQSAVLVTGCYAQNSPKEILELSERVCVLGGQYKGHIADLPELLKQNPALFGEELACFIQKIFEPKAGESFAAAALQACAGRFFPPFQSVP